MSCDCFYGETDWCETCGEWIAACTCWQEFCPECGAPLTEKMSGAECSAECGWWFCY